MKPEDFRPDDLFAQIEGLVEAVDAERKLRERPRPPTGPSPISSPW